MTNRKGNLLKAHLFTDADNMLWEMDTVFAAAQLGLLRQIEQLTGRDAPHNEDQGLTFPGNVDQKLAALILIIYAIRQPYSRKDLP
jgi:hypothetical protein